MGKASKKKKQSIQKDLNRNEDSSSVSHPSLNKKHLFHKSFIHLLLIGVLGFLVYSNTFHSPFQWDEEFFIKQNPTVRDISFFLEPSRAKGLMDEALKSRYIGYLTFALNYRLHGFDVTGYHIVNLSIHIINAFLVYFFLLFTFRTPFFRGEQSSLSGRLSANSLRNDSPVSHHSGLIPLAVALLFVVHPIQTEAVTYVFQRFASLVSMFYLLSLVLYIQGRLLSQSAEDRAQGIKIKETKTIFHALWPVPFYLLSLVSAICAMKTKENAFTLPVMMTIYEFLFFSGQLKTRVLRLMPFLLTMFIIPMMFIGSDTSPGEFIGNVKDPESLGYTVISRTEYLFTQFRVITTYIRLLFLPVNQNLVYDYPLYRSLLALPVLLSFIFLISILGFALFLIYRTLNPENREQRVQSTDKQDISFQLHALNASPHALLYRLVGFGIIWFFITLSVESSIIQIPTLIDEYRVYLPSVGFFLAVTAGGLIIIRRFMTVTLRKEKIITALFGMIILLFSSATYSRNTLWNGTISLWEDVVRKSPGSWIGLNNLGRAYNENGRQEEAIEIFERSIELNPSNSLAYANLGVAYARIGRTDMAIEHFMKAIALNPKDTSTYANLARAYADKGQMEKAADNYRKSAELNPYSSLAYHGLGTALVLLGRHDEAMNAYTKFINLSPKDPEAYKSRGLIYANKGDMVNARSDFQKSCELGSRQGCEYLERIRQEAQ